MKNLISTDSGLIIVAGEPSSGKTTTIMAMLDHINRTRRQHIVTIVPVLREALERAGVGWEALDAIAGKVVRLRVERLDVRYGARLAQMRVRATGTAEGPAKSPGDERPQLWLP